VSTANVPNIAIDCLPEKSSRKGKTHVNDEYYWESGMAAD
jgi:hypothetical protein